MRCLARDLPDLLLRGNDPSPQLLEVARQRFGIPADTLDLAPSDPLPYPDASFDAVVATGVMHHIPDHSLVVSEMLRVARQAIFISDSNWFATGSLPLRMTKLALARVGLRSHAMRLHHGGHEWFYTETDGVAWGYSVFDSAALVRKRCAEVLVLPVAVRDPLAIHAPVLFAPHCLLAGFKQPLPLPLGT
jgi:SAM-dependent methyltransferase